MTNEGTVLLSRDHEGSALICHTVRDVWAGEPYGGDIGDSGAMSLGVVHGKGGCGASEGEEIAVDIIN
jgi:hypothetical protein